MIETTRTERIAKTVEHGTTNSCLVESERQSTSNIPVLQSESNEKVKQQNRLLQNITARESKPSRGTCQSITHLELQVMNKLRVWCKSCVQQK